jgi:hypothetical protein
MDYQMIDETGLAYPYAHFGSRQFGCGVFNAEDLLVARGFHSGWRRSAAHHVAEFGRRPRYELSIPHGVEQTGSMEYLEESVVVRVIHEVEIPINRGRDGRNAGI